MGTSQFTLCQSESCIDINCILKALHSLNPILNENAVALHNRGLLNMPDMPQDFPSVFQTIYLFPLE